MARIRSIHPGAPSDEDVAMTGTGEAVSSTPDPDPGPDVDPDQDPGPDEESSEPPEAASEPALVVFPTVGRGPKQFGFTSSMLEAWADTWPGVDVLGLKAAQARGINDPDAPIVVEETNDPDRVKRLAEDFLRQRGEAVEAAA